MPASFLPGPRTARNLFQTADFDLMRTFYAKHPELGPTPLRSCPGLAHRLGIGQLLAKDETSRFGLNAFKAAGAMFAVSTLRDRGQIRTGDTLICASEGNHGRAVARAARMSGCAAKVYMAEGAAPARVQAIEAEGAEVVLVPGTYDAAVAAAADDAAAHGWKMISDTSSKGDDETARLIMLGYTKLLDEGTGDADVIFVPGGVGGLLAAVAGWSNWHDPVRRPRIVAVEPLSAACLLESARFGAPAVLPGPFTTVMAGLRCGEPSHAAFPAVQTLVDAFIAIEDDWALDAMRRLARPANDDPLIRCGASGAAALGGLMAALQDQALAEVRGALGLGERTRALVLVTEGVTDPEVFERTVVRADTPASHERTPP